MNVVAQTSDEVSWAGAIVPMIVVSLVMIGAGVLVLAIARRTVDGRIGPNAWAGVRTRATRASPEAWRLAHEVALPSTVAAGWLCIALGPACAALGLLLSDTPGRALAIWGVTVTVGAGLVAGFAGWGAIRGHQAAKRLGEGLPDPG